jgi:hypothetical protein
MRARQPSLRRSLGVLHILSSPKRVKGDFKVLVISAANALLTEKHMALGSQFAAANAFRGVIAETPHVVGLIVVGVH